MDKTAMEPSNEKGQTPKPSVTSNTVLNILKRFRKRSKDTTDREPPFLDRLGAASEPLAEQISEISNLIGSDSPQSAEPTTTDNEASAAITPEKDAPDANDAVEANTAKKAPRQRKSRAQSMGFHNPVFPAKAPDAPKDPDFMAATEPPELKIHDAPDGVMENSGAPEKLVTPPKKKLSEPFDLEAFAEQVRTNLPKPETETPAIEDGGSENTETAADAAAFKENFYARISKASNASVFDGFSTEEPKVLHMPVSITNLEPRNITASTALQSWRKFQSPDDRKTEGQEIDQMDKPLRPIDTETPQEAAAAEEPDNDDTSMPDAEAYSAGPEPDRIEEPSLEPQLETAEIEDDRGKIFEGVQEDEPEPAAEQEPEVVKADAAEPETPSDSEPAASGTVNDPEHDPENSLMETIQIAPENLFDALNINEEELLTKVYDAIQAELRAAWGENISLNIRKIVREEVRAAVEKARSDS